MAKKHLRPRHARYWAFTYRYPGSAELWLVKVKAFNFREAWKYATADGAIVIWWKGLTPGEALQINVQVGEY